MKATRDTIVSMHYTLTDDQGDVIDSSQGREPLSYLHGHGNIVPGLERAIEGSSAGDKSKVTVAPEEGYGNVNDELIFEAPREHFPPEVTLKPGAEVYAEGPNGPIRFKILKVTERGALLDGNHPLAGKKLHFEIEVVEVRQATAEEIDHGHAHDGDGHNHDH